MIDEAWVTYTDGNTHYQALMAVLLRSLAEFSTRPVLVYGIRSDFPTQGYPNVAQFTRFNTPDHIWTQKTLVMIHAAAYARKLIFLDSDTVANYSIDELWGQLGHQRVPGLPLLQEHTSLYKNPDANRYTVLTGIPQSRPFGCTSLIWFGEDCIPALTEAADIRRKLEKISPGVGDSECINAVLDSRGYMDNAPLCGPYISWQAHYLKQSPLSSSDMGDVREVYFHAFHGCKWPADAQKAFDAMRGVRLPTHFSLPSEKA